MKDEALNISCRKENIVSLEVCRYIKTYFQTHARIRSDSTSRLYLYYDI